MNISPDILRFGRSSVLISVAFIAWLASCLHKTEAAPVRLHCVLSSPVTAARPNEITIAFDAERNSLSVDRGQQHFDLGHVTISTISVDGYTQAMSIGIDRSSWSIVVQTYSQTPSIAEFGVCKQSPPSAVPDHS